MRAYDSEVCSACVCEILLVGLCVHVYATAMYVARMCTGTPEKIGQFGHTLGACRDNHQHKPPNNLEQMFEIDTNSRSIWQGI